MLRFESAELEKEVLSGGSCIAVPIEIFVPTRGEPIVTAYSDVYKRQAAGNA